jgi:hypothetical protein
MENQINVYKPKKCEYCEYPTDDLEEHGALRFPKRFPDRTKLPVWLCRICSRVLGQNDNYPSQDTDRDVLRAICYIGNEIIWEIKRVEENLENRLNKK